MNSSLDDQNSVLLKENSKLKEQIEIKNRELDKLEHVLLANLAHKEQEIADLSAQIEDMKASSNPCNQQLRCMGLDPAVNAVFLRIKKDMKAANEKLEQTQNDLQAWKFTPDSQTGKRMMTRMRVLLQENEELGKMNQSGRTAKLESEIAMKRSLVEELKQTNSEYENVIDEMDTETDCFQTSIFMLQQQLGIARTTISALCSEVESLSPGRSQPILAHCSWVDSPLIKKEEHIDIDPCGDQEINGTNSRMNNLTESHAVSLFSSDSDLQLTSKLSKTECDSNSDGVFDDRTSNDNTIGAAANSKFDSIVTGHNKLMPEIIDPKSEATDGDNQKIVSKKRTISSNSTFNQKKKLTSS